MRLARLRCRSQRSFSVSARLEDSCARGLVNDSMDTSSGEPGLAGARWLVVNADDFGMTSRVNEGIIQAHERGIVTSASLMVRGPAAAAGAEYARGRVELGVGLHVELRDWRVRRAPWARVRSEQALRAAVEAEVGKQLEQFRELVGHDPTHLDSHHHRHRIDSLRSIFLEFAKELHVPLRHFSRGIGFCGEFYGQDGRGRPEPQVITPDGLVALLERLPAGVTELGSHPGYPEGLRSTYREERVREVRTLCDPVVREALARFGIRLVTFREAWARANKQAGHARNDAR
jgi:predicted glycoside hydrolase/deacetylase ChbG (UPF0249 family)